MNKEEFNKKEDARVEAIMSLMQEGFFRHWMPRTQRMILAECLNGEESQHFIDMLTDLKERIETMPKSHETDGQGDEVIVHLHYFKGAVDAWITEKDVGDGEDMTQWQAFGKVNLYGSGIKNAELGYVCIQELIEAGVELDLYWTPKKLKDCK